MKQIKDILVTIPFEELLVLCLGEEKLGSYCIPPVTAEVIEYHINENKLHTLYKVQKFDHDLKPLPRPILWSYGEWSIDKRNYDRQKAHSERERIARRILSANVKLVAEAYREFTGVEDIALSETMAYSLLVNSKTKSITALGVSKLITTEEEI